MGRTKTVLSRHVQAGMPIMSRLYDVIVIGSGVGGYTTAIRLSQSGLRVLLIERKLIGGECANYGCVPTKALYSIAKSVRQLRVARFSISWSGNPLEFAREAAAKAREGIAYLLDRYGVEIVYGEARVARNAVVKVLTKNGRVEHYEYRYLVIATGTEPRALPNIPIDEITVLSNRGFLNLDELPSSVIIVGGGAIGVELASILANIGVKVRIVEVAKDILPGMDIDIVRTVKRFLREQEVEIFTSSTIEEILKTGNQVEVKLSSGPRIQTEKILIAIGRRPQTRDLGLEEINVRVDSQGYIVVDSYQRTSNPKVFAVGDVTGPPLLAHKALIEGRIAAHTILGKKVVGYLNREIVPVAYFTIPEIGSIGLSEDAARKRGYKVRCVKIPVTVSSRAFIEGCEGGFIKIVMDETSGSVLGLHMVGPNASELASVGLEIIERKLELETVASRPYVHLTAFEILRELAETVLGEPVNIYIPKR